MNLKIFSLCLLLGVSMAAVFEGASSENVKFFINDNPKANRALMFYDQVQEVAQKQTKKWADEVVGIFMPKGDPKRSKLDWVDQLNDGVNLMRVDAYDSDNKEIVKEFGIDKTPYIIVFNEGKTQFEEVVDDFTPKRLKETLLLKPQVDKQNAGIGKDGSWSSDSSKNDKKDLNQNSQTKPLAPKKPTYNPPKKPASPKPQSPKQEKPKKEEPKQSEEEKALAKAEKKLMEALQLNDIAKKEVEKSTKALEEAKKKMVEFADVEKAKKNAQNAQKATDDAMKEYNEAKRKVEEKTRKVRAIVMPPEVPRVVAPQPRAPPQVIPYMLPRTGYNRPQPTRIPAKRP